KDKKWFNDQFDFIPDTALRDRLGLEFYSARYLYKLGEALAVTEERTHAHAKFQITQYASIYEAVIVDLLWNKYATHPAVVDIDTHSTFRKVATLPETVKLTTAGGEKIHWCVEKKEKTSVMSIKFDDKVDASVAIGFINKVLGEEIKEFYKLRNAMHID